MTLNMQGTHKKFFKHVNQARLTGEQLRVLCVMLENEADGDITIFQKEIAEELGMAESNVSRSVKALVEAGLIKPFPGKLWRGGKYVDGLSFKIAKPFSN